MRDFRSVVIELKFDDYQSHPQDVSVVDERDHHVVDFTGRRLVEVG